MQENIQQLRAQIAERDKELMEEASRADGPLKQRMLQSRARLAEVEQKREQLAVQTQELRAKVNDMTRLFEEEREKFENVRGEQQAARQALEHADSALRNLQASQENALNRFGNFAANIVMAIDREKGWKQKPVSLSRHGSEKAWAESAKTRRLDHSVTISSSRTPSGPKCASLSAVIGSTPS